MCTLAPAERAAIHFAREDECGGMRMRVPGCRAGVPPFSCRRSPCRVLPRKMRVVRWSARFFTRSPPLPRRPACSSVRCTALRAHARLRRVLAASQATGA